MNLSSNKQYKTTVSLVVYNGAKYLPFVLQRLADQTADDFFVLIIDNNSVDESVKIVSDFLLTVPAFAKRCRVIKNNKNFGFARGHNQAIYWSSSEYILMLNQDVLLETDYIKTLELFMDKHPEAGAAQGKILKWNFNQASYRLDLHKNLHKMSKFDSCGLVVSKSRHSYNLNEGEFDQGQSEEEAEVFGVVGTVPIYRREALNKVAFDREVLDEDFVMYKEDVDLAWRLRWAGWKSFYLPKAVAYHDRSFSKPERLSLVTKSRSHWPPQLKVYSCRNHWLVLLKNECWSNLIRYMPQIVWYESSKFFYRLFLETFVLLRAIGQFISLAPRVIKKRRFVRKTAVITCAEIRVWFV